MFSLAGRERNRTLVMKDYKQMNPLERVDVQWNCSIALLQIINTNWRALTTFSLWMKWSRTHTHSQYRDIKILKLNEVGKKWEKLCECNSHLGSVKSLFKQVWKWSIYSFPSKEPLEKAVQKLRVQPDVRPSSGLRPLTNNGYITASWFERSSQRKMTKVSRSTGLRLEG